MKPNLRGSKGIRPEGRGEAPAPAPKAAKVQLKVQLAPDIHGKLRSLCDLHRRTPAGQIEFMALAFYQKDIEGAGPGLRPGEQIRPTAETVSRTRRPQ